MGVFNSIEALIFHLTHFRSLGQVSKNNFVRFLVQIRTRKFVSEIYVPIVDRMILYRWTRELQKSPMAKVSQRKCTCMCTKVPTLAMF